MSFRVVYSEVWRLRVERLLIAAKSSGSHGPVRNALLQLHEIMERDPIKYGEPLYELKHAKLMVNLVVRRFFSAQYAVDPDRQIVYVMRLSLSGKHPYPPEFDEIRRRQEGIIVLRPEEQAEQEELRQKVLAVLRAEGVVQRKGEGKKGNPYLRWSGIHSDGTQIVDRQNESDGGNDRAEAIIDMLNEQRAKRGDGPIEVIR